MKAENKILAMTFDFALQIIILNKKLVDCKEYVLSRQLLRSGTSIGANVEEAVAGQSKRDFTAKMALASKEARETRYWLRLLEKSELAHLDYAPYLTGIEHIISILTKIVKTSQTSLSQ